MIRRNLLGLAVIGWILMLTSCGGSSNASSGEASQAARDALSAAYAVVVSLAQDSALQACFSGQMISCTCPGGGTVTVSGQTLLFESCASATGAILTGSMTVDASALNGSFSIFGECASATTTGISTNGCSGTITATCLNESVTGTIVQGSGSGCVLSFDGGGGGGSATVISMIAPYVSEAEFLQIPEAFDSSAAHSSPWGFEHLGIDLQPIASGARIQAVADGTVESITNYLNPINGLWQANVSIRYNGAYIYGYFFEPSAASEAELQTQLAAIAVAVGQAIKQGDLVGSIVKINSDNLLVHFNFRKEGADVCPEPYFTSDAQASLLRLLHVRWPGASLCYQ